MSRARTSAPPEAIRIEDEVWKEAFTRREPSPSRAARRLRALEGGRVDAAPRRPARPRSARASRPQPVSAPSAPASAPPAAEAATGRRTVVIRGRGAERNLPWPDASRRRAPRRAYERTGFKPDRVAMWAVLLGLLLVLVAVLSAHS